VVTDHIETFTETGIELTSGQHLDADIIVTATGLDLLPFGGIDMSVYTQATDGSALELTAIYTPRISAYAPAHLRMALNEGDAVSFGLPGAPGVTYSFARSAQGVTVRADETAVQLASN